MSTLKQFCKYGHNMADAIKRKNGKRYCRECHKKHKRDNLARNKDKIPIINYMPRMDEESLVWLEKNIYNKPPVSSVTTMPQRQSPIHSLYISEEKKSNLMSAENVRKKLSNFLNDLLVGRLK